MARWGTSGVESEASTLPAAQHPCVLLADDDVPMRCLLAEELRRDGYEVVEAADGVELLDHLAANFPWVHEPGTGIDVIVSDIRMPGFTGLDVLCFLRIGRRMTPIILITAFGDEETRAEALELGAAAVLDKPFEIDELRAAIRRTVPRC